MKAISFEDYSGKYESLQMTRQDGILEVTLHTNGKSLVFSRTVHEELGFAFADIAADRDNKVVILTGTGETFCTDFDPESFKSFNGLGKNITAIGWDQTVWRGQHNIRRQLEISVPMIGVLNGPATVHSELALLGDIVLAADTAVIQDFPHFGNGVAPGDGVQVIFPLLMGLNRGRYFLLTQQKLSAQKALDLGLVNEVLPRNELMLRARELAAQIAQQPPLALRYARLLLTQRLKQLMDESVGYGLALEGLSAIETFRNQG
jgi:enoyl-CoA hydratase/carnithine racemase